MSEANQMEIVGAVGAEDRSYNLKRIISYNEETNEYFVEWEDNSTSEIPAENVSPEAIRVFNIIKTHNDSVIANCTTAGIQPVRQKAYIVIRCSVAKDSSVETQHLALLNFCLHNNILVEYYSVDKGVSGRYNIRKSRMNNLDYEFGVKLNYINETNIIVINSIDRLGRHAKTMMDLIENLMARNITMCFIDVELILTPDNFKSRAIHMLVYEHCLRAQELSDEISKRVKASIKTRRENGKLLKPAVAGNIKLVNNEYLCKMVMRLYEKYNELKFSSFSKSVKRIRVYNEIVKLGENNNYLKNMKLSQSLINNIIKKGLKRLDVGNSEDSDNVRMVDADADDESSQNPQLLALPAPEAAPKEAENHLMVVKEPFSFKNFFNSIMESVAPVVSRFG